MLKGKLKQNVGLHPHSKIEDEQRIVELADSIDEQIVMLDNRLDMVLENHEKDFLSAYRLHMVRVQQELTELKTRGTEAQLQLKQEKWIAALELELNHYRRDCVNIQKFCNMQS